MSKKSNAALSPKASICKEPNCFDGASIKGFCRLHFIKALAGKSEAEEVVKGEGKSRDRRRSDRFKGVDTPNSEESMDPLAMDVSGGELDADIEDLDLEPTMAPRFKKAG